MNADGNWRKKHFKLGSKNNKVYKYKMPEHCGDTHVHCESSKMPSVRVNQECGCRRGHDDHGFAALCALHQSDQHQTLSNRISDVGEKVLDEVSDSSRDILKECCDSSRDIMKEICCSASSIKETVNQGDQFLAREIADVKLQAQRNHSDVLVSFRDVQTEVLRSRAAIEKDILLTKCELSKEGEKHHSSEMLEMCKNTDRISRELAKCCCELEQKIEKKFCDAELRGLQSQVADLQRQLLVCQLTSSGAAATAAVAPGSGH